MRKTEVKSRERGFALLLMLVGLAVVALVVAAVVDGARRYAREAEAEVAQAKARLQHRPTYRLQLALHPGLRRLLPARHSVAQQSIRTVAH